MDRLRFCLNDRWVELPDTSPTTTLLRYLRDQAHLTGTKEGCAEGDCGACTVAVVESTPDGRATYRAINACLLLLPMVQGKRVYTVEALKRDGRYHLVQQTLAEKLGSQCGYCTPGVAMALFEACYRPDMDAPWKADAQMCGNLCRCTGYRPIREATLAVAGARPDDYFGRALKAAATPVAMDLHYRAGEQHYFNPGSERALWEVFEAHPRARVVVGGTDLSLEVTKRHEEPRVLVSLEAIASFRGVRALRGDGGWRIGATTALTDLEDWAEKHLPPLERMLRYFGARAIKSRATVGGNLCNASPIGDLPPVLLSLGATAVLASRDGERRLPLEDFFLGYRKTALREREVLAAVEVPSPPEGAYLAAYKVSKRRELDISAVAAGFLVTTGADGRVQTARLAYGGMAATPARARKTEAALVGQPWTAASVRAAAAHLGADFTPLSDHRGSARYRGLVARNFLIGFFEETRTERAPRLSHGHPSTLEVR
jgi:xanthine dehydrogenase small subunit